MKLRKIKRETGSHLPTATESLLLSSLQSSHNIAWTLLHKTTTTLSFLVVISCLQAHPPLVTTTAIPLPSSTPVSTAVGIAKYRSDYDNSTIQPNLIHNEAHSFSFKRFQSPQSIRRALSDHEHDLERPSSFQYYHSKVDGREGYISCIKLGNDYILAQSEQIAKQTQARDVLDVYLNGELQQKWNHKEVLNCKFHCKDIGDENGHSGEDEDEDEDSNDVDVQNGAAGLMLRGPSSFQLNKLKQRLIPSTKTIIHNNSRNVDHAPSIAAASQTSTRSNSNENNNHIESATGKYYEQDLTLKSQRIITSHTGIMRYTQIITIDQIGKNNYSVIVRLDDSNGVDKKKEKIKKHLLETNSSSKNPSLSSSPGQGEEETERTATLLKPFDSLLVHVSLQQRGDDVHIYADGIMKVNRKVVPNLIVFDASGIAGTMAGKGTLWLGAYFAEKNKNREKIK